MGEVCCCYAVRVRYIGTFNFFKLSCFVFLILQESHTTIYCANVLKHEHQAESG